MEYYERFLDGFREQLVCPRLRRRRGKDFQLGGHGVLYGTAGTATLTGNITVGGLNFGTTAYTINTGANTLSLGSASAVAITLNNAATATPTTAMTQTITGAVSGSGNITLTGGVLGGIVGNTLTFQGTSTGGWSGTTTINVGQTLKLAGLSQALLNTTGITLNGGGINLTNTTAAEAALDRVSNSATIISNGGTITVANTVAAGTAYSEAIGAVTAAAGRLDINSNTSNTGGTQVLTLSNLTQSGSGTVAFSIAGLTATTQLGVATNKIVATSLASTAANAIIGPWATVGTATNAQTDYAVNNINAGTVNALGIQGANITASVQTAWGTTYASTNNYTFSAAQTLTATRIANSLRYTGAGGTILTVGTGFNLNTYGILQAGGAAATIAATGTGTLSTPTGGGNLYLITGGGFGLTISAPIVDNGGAVTPVISGSNGITLSGANTFTGGIVITAGSLTIGANNVLGAVAGGLTFNSSGGLAFFAATTVGTSGTATNRAIALNNFALATITTGAFNSSLIGNISGTGGIILAGTSGNTLTIGQSGSTSTYTGPTIINVGTLKAGVANAFGNGSAVNLSNTAGTVMDITGFNVSIGSLSGGGTTSGNVTLGAATLTIGTNHESTSYAGVISGTGGSITKTGTGILTLTGTNTFTGAVTISNGFINVGNVTNLGAGTAISISGGGLQFSANTTNNIADPSSRTITINAGGATFDTNNNQIIFASAVGGSGAGGLTKAGPGTLFLLGANTYTGATTVNAGVLNLQNATAVSAGSSVTVGSGAALALQGGLNFGAKPLTLSGTGAAAGMSGALVNASGANTYGGAITLAANATISSDVGSLALSSATAIAGTGFALTLGGASGGTVSSSIGTGAAGSLFKTGAGTWTLSGTTANYTGATSITGGTLSITGGALGSTSGTTLGGGTLALTSGSQNIGNLTVSAGSTNTVTVGASSTLTLGSTLARSVGGIVEFDISASGAAIASASAAGVLGYATINDGTVGMAYASGTNIVRLSSFSGGILADNTNAGANDYTTAGMAANPLLWSNTLTTRSVNS